MSVKPGYRPLGHPDYHALVSAALFLLCALVSSLGGGLVALLFFFPAVVAAEFLMRRVARRGQLRFQRRM